MDNNYFRLIWVWGTNSPQPCYKRRRNFCLSVAEPPLVRPWVPIWSLCICRVHSLKAECRITDFAIRVDVCSSSTLSTRFHIIRFLVLPQLNYEVNFCSACLYNRGDLNKLVFPVDLLINTWQSKRRLHMPGNCRS